MPAFPAHIIGTGLVTALGRGLPAHVAALRAGTVRPMPSPVTFQGQVLPYHFASAARGEPAAFLAMIDAAVGDALAQAALPAEAQARMGVFVGSTSLDLPLLEAGYEAGYASGTPPMIHAPGHNTLARHIALRFALRGPQFSFSTACSSSANAALYARAMLAQGRIDHALVVGADGYNRLTLLGFAGMMLLTRTQYRPFDAVRDGMILGEGVGALVLGRSGPAGGATIAGGATACDPTSPTGSTAIRIAEVMRAALDDAGLPAQRIAAIKAHGTGTTGNDLSEGLAVRTVFGDEHPPLTSIKPCIGHTLGACGTIEIAAMLAAWREGFLPPTPGFAEPDAGVGLRPQVAPFPLGPGAMLCNYIGFGGNNTSLVLAR